MPQLLLVREWFESNITVWAFAPALWLNVRLCAAPVAGGFPSECIAQTSNTVELSTTLPTINSIVGSPVGGYRAAGGDILTLQVEAWVFMSVATLDVLVGTDNPQVGLSQATCGVLPLNFFGNATLTGQPVTPSIAPLNSSDVAAAVVDACTQFYGAAP